MSLIKPMRDKILQVLPYAQFIITLFTLSSILSLEPKHPQYFCTQPNPYVPLVICNPK